MSITLTSPGASTSTSASTLISASTLLSASTSSSPSSHSSKTDAGAIAGGAIGCAFGGALILALLFWLYKKCRTSRPEPGTSPQMSEHKILITDPPPSPGLPVAPSTAPSTGTIASPPPLTDSLTVQQAYQDALQKTYVSIPSRHLALDADINIVGSRRYPDILYIPTVQKRGPARTAPQHRISLGSSWTILC